MQAWTQYKEAQTPEDAIKFLSWMREQDNTTAENLIIDAAVIDILSIKWKE